MTNMQAMYSEYMEKVRHDKETERQNLIDLNEKIRHQITMDTETMRHNLVSEAEISKHNRVTEEIMRYEAQIKEFQVRLQDAREQQKILTNAQLELLKQKSSNLIDLLKTRISAASTLSNIEKAQNDISVAVRQLELNASRTTAQNAKDYATAYGSLKGILANVIGKPVDEALQTPTGKALAYGIATSSQGKASVSTAKRNATAIAKNAKSAVVMELKEGAKNNKLAPAARVAATVVAGKMTEGKKSKNSGHSR